MKPCLEKGASMGALIRTLTLTLSDLVYRSGEASHAAV